MVKEENSLDYEPLKRRRASEADAETDPASWIPRSKNVEVQAIPESSNKSSISVKTLTPAQPRLRGHGLTYAGLILFTIVTYFRPQEFFLPLAGAQLALYFALITLALYLPSQLALKGNMTARPREVNLLLIITVMVLLSIPFGISPADAVNSFWEFFKAVIVFIVIVNVVHTERRLHGMFFLAMAVTCTLAVGAINDYRLGNLTVEGYRVQGIIKGGMFENPNDLGIHLATMFPLATMLALASRRLFGKLLYVIASVLILAASVVTFSRGNFLGLVGASLVMAWRLSRRNRPLVIVSVVVILGTFIALTPPSYWLRIASIFDARLDAFGSSTMRGELLKQSFLVTLRHPLIGVGIGNFPLMSIRSLVSHNSYTQVGAEIGMFALLIYAMFIVAPLRRLRRIEQDTLNVKEQNKFYFLAVGLQGSLIAYMVSSFFAAVAFYWFIYYLVGYAVCFRQIYDDASVPSSIYPSTADRHDYEKTTSPQVLGHA